MIKVVHVMADGERRDSIEGVTIPASCDYYKVKDHIIREIREKEADRQQA